MTALELLLKSGEIRINTGTGCHLEADMLPRGVDQLRLQESSLRFVENVGNLVCPALFDLGEWAKVVILSVTEGEDKLLKYPHYVPCCSIDAAEQGESTILPAI